MRGRYTILALGLLLCLGACRTSEITFTEGDEQELAHLLNRKALQFEARLAEGFPRQTLVATTDRGNLQRYGTYVGFVDIQGFDFYLTLHGDKVKAVLPYYSQKERFENYKGRDWIELEVPITDLKYYRSRSHRIADIQFKARNLTEPFDIHIRLFGNKKSKVTVYSPHRDRISYYGRVEEHLGGR